MNYISSITAGAKASYPSGDINAYQLRLDKHYFFCLSAVGSVHFVAVGSYGKRGGFGVPTLLKDTRTYIPIDCIRTSSGLTLPLNKKVRRTTNTLSGVGICCSLGLWVVGRCTKGQTLKGNSSPSCKAVYPENKGLTVSDNLSIRLHRISERAC
jgi:hypothetical protein